MLVILAFMGLLVIGLAVAIGTGTIDLGPLGPAAAPRPAAAAKQGTSGPSSAPVMADEPLVVPPPPLLSDRAIVLEPEAAKLSGKVILADTTFSGEKKNARREERKAGKRPVYPLLTRFVAPDDVAEWTFAVPEAGQYSVTVDYSLQGRGEGKPAPPYVLSVAEGTLPFAFDFTRSASSFQLVDVGTVYLPAGAARLTLRPESKLSGSNSLNLRNIRLFPTE